ncbi:hypothetical protein [Streptomyces sp. NPDC006285]|uniref:hypothetical protein n=1 Tax=Streptomyces sp. NPDC006285 TaxID=3364742 RepID=UPI003677F690
MDNGIQLISDGDGLAVIGSETDVERFLVSEGLSLKDRGLRRLTSVAGTGALVAQAGSDIAAESACWVKLTRESAQVVKKYGLRESSTTGLSTGVVKGPKGQVRSFVEFASGPRSLLGNPAALAHAAGIMAQLAMQQTMDEITDYLATISPTADPVSPGGSGPRWPVSARWAAYGWERGWHGKADGSVSWPSCCSWRSSPPPVSASSTATDAAGHDVRYS